MPFGNSPILTVLQDETGYAWEHMLHFNGLGNSHYLVLHSALYFHILVLFIHLMETFFISLLESGISGVCSDQSFGRCVQQTDQPEVPSYRLKEWSDPD